MRNRWKNTTYTFAVLCLVVLLFYLFAPIQIGGGTSYIIISGISMEPDIRKGDIVIARKQRAYSVGEAVVYRHPSGAHVFHRIVGQENDEFILRGDNNTWLDSHQPTTEEILGKQWIHIPFIGKIIEKLRAPGYIALITFLMIATFANLSKPYKDRKSKCCHKNKMKRKTSQPNGSINTNLEVALVLLAVAIGALILGIIAFTRPTQKWIADDFDYQHLSTLSYHAPDVNDLYDANHVKTGEPVFLQSNCDLRFDLSYQLISPSMLPEEADQFSGAYQVSARVSDPNGWNRSFQLASITEFSGSSFNVDMNLDLCNVRDLINELEQKTGATTGWYNLTIYPEI